MINSDTFSGPSFSIKNRFARVIWKIIYYFLFRPSPTPLHIWRVFILRLFGAKIGKGVHFYPRVDIWAPWNITVGNYSGIANGVILYSQGEIIIGEKVVISQGAHLCTGSHDYTQKGFPLYTKPIVIHSHAWIAAEAFIHPGVIIQTGVVVGARSVVISNLPEWMVCSGHPCVPIKSRSLS